MVSKHVKRSSNTFTSYDLILKKIEILPIDGATTQGILEKLQIRDICQKIQSIAQKRHLWTKLVSKTEDKNQ